MRRLILLALVCALVPAEVTAQRVMGTVMLPGGAAPAAGTVIAAEDTTGRETAHTVVRDDGTFMLYVDSTRVSNLKALRVGFTPVEFLKRHLRDGETETVALVLGGDALTWPRSAPRGATTCGGGRDEGRAVVNGLLEEARKVMLASQYRIGRADVNTRYATFQHRTAKNGEDTLYSLIRRSAGSAPVLFQEIETADLERRGFFAMLGAERVFIGPELTVLNSPWFTETHCFTLRQVTTGEFVMSFEPSRERKGLVDVSGEYRLDRVTGGLRSISYQYVGLPAEEKKSGAGGVIEFARASNGNWLAQYWYQRFPLLGYRQSSGTTTFVQSQMTLVDIIGHRTIGGRVTALLREDGRPLYQHDPLTRPTATSPFGTLCSERLVTASTAAARGKLTANDSLGVDRLAVRATWKVLVVVDRTEMAEREQVRETVTNADGEWALCDLPVNRDLKISWDIRGNVTERPMTITQPNTLTVVQD